MSTVHDSKYRCPVCTLPLNKSVGVAGVSLWCGNIRCPSEVMDRGTDGTNEDDCHAALCRAANAEQEELWET